jgi:hypothetical protein
VVNGVEGGDVDLLEGHAFLASETYRQHREPSFVIVGRKTTPEQRAAMIESHQRGSSIGALARAVRAPGPAA